MLYRVLVNPLRRRVGAAGELDTTILQLYRTVWVGGKSVVDGSCDVAK
jgi:hypothetical protein